LNDNATLRNAPRVFYYDIYARDVTWRPFCFHSFFLLSFDSEGIWRYILTDIMADRYRGGDDDDAG